MDIEKYLNEDKLDLFAFYWTEARLVIASFALFLGGIPPVMYLFKDNYSSMSLLSSLLNICWIISGLVAGYMLWRFFKNDKKVFDGKDQLGTVAFLVSVVTGLNLGIAGITKTNIGMSITMNPIIFWITGIIYLASAGYLFMKWNDYGKKLF